MTKIIKDIRDEKGNLVRPNWWGEDGKTSTASLKIHKNKCVMILPLVRTAQGCINSDIGVIAAIGLDGIRQVKVVVEPSEIRYEFAKKYAERIKYIAKAYFNCAIKVDALAMSEVIMFYVNSLLPQGPEYNLSGKPMGATI